MFHANNGKERGDSYSNDDIAETPSLDYSGEGVSVLKGETNEKHTTM